MDLKKIEKPEYEIREGMKVYWFKPPLRDPQLIEIARVFDKKYSDGSRTTIAKFSYKPEGSPGVVFDAVVDLKKPGDNVFYYAKLPYYKPLPYVEGYEYLPGIGKEFKEAEERFKKEATKHDATKTAGRKKRRSKTRRVKRRRTHFKGT